MKEHILLRIRNVINSNMSQETKIRLIQEICFEIESHAFKEGAIYGRDNGFDEKIWID